MRIAQIAPLMESVPPRLYGGTERIVSYLTEALVKAGHEVTLFASGDSISAANLVPGCDAALRLLPTAVDPMPYHLMMLEEVRRRASDFDVMHAHVDVLQFPVMRDHQEHCLTTMHGRLDLPEMHRLYSMFDSFPLVSISNHQRLPMPPVRWAGTVYHGLPKDLLPFSPVAAGGYLAFLGRISPEKRPDRAIEIAVRAGLPLKIAAKVDRADKAYWDDVIAPMIKRHPNVEYIGEINEREKVRFLGDAVALLFPIDWPEPFGLVMIEAMSCGTPVVAFPCGSVPEVLSDGRTGFIVTSVEEAALKLQNVAALDRHVIRREFEQRFSAERMAADYVTLYQQHQVRPERRVPTVRRNNSLYGSNGTVNAIA